MVKCGHTCAWVSYRMAWAMQTHYATASVEQADMFCYRKFHSGAGNADVLSYRMNRALWTCYAITSVAN